MSDEIGHIRDRDETLRLLPSRIDLVVFDFDGVFTNNEVVVHQDGTESVVCNRSDGLGISFLRGLNIPMTIISTEENSVVRRRAEKLKLTVIHDVKDKKSVLLEMADKKGLNLENTIYVGNDINDLECIKMVGTSVAPADAHPAIKSIVDIVLQNGGGKGAVRELADYIIDKVRSIAR